MPEISRSQLAVYAVALCAIAWLGARYLSRQPSPSPGAAGPPPVARTGGVEVRRSGGGTVTVHVAGAVRRPGVYSFRAGTRVQAAVRRAGGPRQGADLDGLNLAGKLEDARQIVVPRRVAAAAPGPAAAGAGTGAGGTAAPAAPVDLNTATLEQLDTLDGVGPSTAQKILDYRQEHGGFGSVEELGQVTGIGEKRMAALRDKVRV